MNCSTDLKNFVNSRLKVENFKNFLNHYNIFSLSVVQSNFENKIQLCMNKCQRVHLSLKELCISPKKRQILFSYCTKFLFLGNLEAKFGDMTKRNYNLDHLARMNFRRSYRTGQLSTRHILGGL